MVALITLFLLMPMQTKPAEPERTPLPKHITELIDRARSVPPEFSADALLRIAESDVISDSDTRKELIQEAFRKAGAAQEPMKRRALKPGGGDTRVSFQARAYAQDLDALSLQSRAVIAMVRLDKPKARELFSQIPVPRVPKLTCADSLVYDVSAFAEALSQIAGNAFTAKERAEDAHAKLLAGFAGGIASAAEVGPMARTIASANLSPAQLQMVATAFAAALKSLAADDRSFSSTLNGAGAMLPDIAGLMAACKRQQVSTAGLAEAVRGYLARHLLGKRCADTGGFTINIGVSPGNAQPQEPDAVTFFNTRVLPDVYPSGSRIPPLGGDEIRASSVEEPDTPDQPVKSAELTQLLDRYNGLLFNPLGTSWSSEQKNETVWRAKLSEYLSSLSAWKPGADMSASEFFYLKCYLMSSLVNVVPNGPSRELVLRSFVDFLQQNGYMQGSRIEWFLPVNTMLFRVLTDQALSGLADEMRNSGDAVVALYAQLNSIVPPSPAKIMALM